MNESRANAFTVNINFENEDFHRQARRKAKKHRLSLSEYVCHLIQSDLNEKKTSTN